MNRDNVNKLLTRVYQLFFFLAFLSLFGLALIALYGSEAAGLASIPVLGGMFMVTVTVAGVSRAARDLLLVYRKAA